MKYEELKEQIKEDLEEGRSIIPGDMEEAKEIGRIIDELEEEGEVEPMVDLTEGD